MERYSTRDIQRLTSQVSQAMAEFPLDVVVHTAGGQVRGYSRNFAAHSPVMKKLIQNATVPEIHLPTIQEHIFKLILVYIYSGEVLFMPYDAVEMLEAAYKLQMTGLQDICIKRLKEEMSLAIVMDCLHVAFKHGIADLKPKCGELLCIHFADVLAAPDFLTLHPDELHWYVTLLVGNLKTRYADGCNIVITFAKIQ